MKPLFCGSIWLKQRKHNRWQRSYDNLDWNGFSPHLFVKPELNGLTWNEQSHHEYSVKDLNIVNNYKYLRRRFLETNMEWCLFWEDDVYVPPFTLKLFMEQNAHAVGLVIRNWCPQVRKEGTFYGSWRAEVKRVFPPDDSNDEVTFKSLRYDAEKPNSAGLGFSLLHRSVLEKVDFIYCRYFPAAVDINFWVDVELFGFKHKILFVKGVIHEEERDETKEEFVKRIAKTIDFIEGWFFENDIRVLTNIELPENPVIVECGTYKGKSTEALKMIWSSADIHTCDIYDYPDRVRLENFFHGKGVDMPWDKPIDLLFIDDSHICEDVRANFLRYEPFIKKGGYAVFHDYKYPGGGVEKAVKEIQGNVIIHENGDYGTAIWRKNA